MASPKVVYIGLDAFDPSLARQLIAKGSLPAIASVLATAMTAPLENPAGVYVGAVWPTMATTTGPGTHGRYCWGQAVAHRYEVRFMQPSSMPMPPFWAELDRAGLRLAVVDVPLAPVVELRHGVQVANYETHDAPEPIASWPPSVGDGLGRSAGVDCDELARAGRHADLVGALERGVAAKGDLLCALAADAPDALVGVFGAGHCIGHQCWHQHDPAHLAHDGGSERDPVEHVYDAIDRQVGRVLEQAPDASVVLHLSHGMTSHTGCSQIIEPVVRRISDAIAGPGAVRTFVERYRQSSRYHANRLLRRAGQGDPLLVRLVESSRAAEAIPNNDAHAGIRFNVRGREPRGRIEPDQLPALRDAFVRHLLEVRDLDTDVPVVSAVLDTDDVHPGPRRDDLPDLLVLFHPDARGERVESPLIGRIEKPYLGNRTGDHRPGGLLAIRSTGTAATTGDAVRTVDVAPSIAALLGTALRATDGRACLQPA